MNWFTSHTGNYYEDLELVYELVEDKEITQIFNITQNIEDESY